MAWPVFGTLMREGYSNTEEKENGDNKKYLSVQMMVIESGTRSGNSTDSEVFPILERCNTATPTKQ